MKLEKLCDPGGIVAHRRWVLGGQFASAALPAIFREDDPPLEVRLSQEAQRDLNDRLNSLPPEVFTADDSLGWVYQFWQSEEKDRVNASSDKIDGLSIPAVTQLFTEHYLVLFLLHNTLGAWHAGKVLAQNPSLDLNAKNEAELRRAVALETAGGYESESLRFVQVFLFDSFVSCFHMRLENQPARLVTHRSQMHEVG